VNESKSDRRTYKHALTSSKILACGSDKIADFFMNIEKFRKEEDKRLRQDDNNDSDNGMVDSKQANSDSEPEDVNIDDGHEEEAPENPHHQEEHTTMMVVIDGEEEDVSVFKIDESKYEYLVTLLEPLLELQSGITKKEDFNLTAAHYIVDVLSSLVNNSDTIIEFFKFIYTKQEYLDAIVDNCSETSLLKLLHRILNTHANEFNNKAQITFSFLHHRLLLYLKCFDKFVGEPEETRKFEAFAQLFNSLIDGRENILDGEYLVERIFHDEKRFGTLLNSMIEAVF